MDLFLFLSFLPFQLVGVGYFFMFFKIQFAKLMHLKHNQLILNTINTYLFFVEPAIDDILRFEGGTVKQMRTIR